MKVELQNIGKRFKEEWIFKEVNTIIEEKSKTVITGFNGSGKSTILRIISGFEKPSVGKVFFNGESIEKQFQNISICSPALKLPGELTLDETLNFHSKFRPFDQDIDSSSFNLQVSKGKRLQDYSSGMLQRVKLGLSIFSQSTILLLDEPISNLDVNGINWYKEIIETRTKDKTVVVASNNIEDEYYFCKNELNINKFK
jgi:ABC-type multidrug transport system ATPase subunit